MKRLTFEGNFCDIALCLERPGGEHCGDGACSQRKVWERLKEYEDLEEQGRLKILPCAVLTKTPEQACREIVASWFQQPCEGGADRE